MKKFESFLVALILIFLYGCEREITRSEAIKFNPVNRKVMLNSNPPGANIFLNGKIQGKITPDTISWLPDSTVSFTLKKKLYRDTTFQFTPGENVDDVFIDYHDNPKMFGAINCLTIPEGAEIIIEGENTGKITPYTFKNKIPGIYKVKYLLDGFRSAVYEYEVSSDETSGNYITLKDTTVWVTYNNLNSGMPENEIWSVSADMENTIWIGTATSGLVKYNAGEFTVIPMSYFGMSDVAIYQMSVDSLNNLWMGTSQGLIRYGNGNFDLYTTENSELPGDVINDIAAHFNSKVWVGTSHGAAEYDKNSWTVYTTQNSEIQGNTINVINTNVFGEVWLGFAKDGLGIWNGVRFKPVRNFYWDSGPPPGNTVYAIAQERTGKVWVGFFPEDFPGGGAGGLTTYDGGRWANNYSGQISREIYDIVIGNDNKKFVATPEGLCAFFTWADKKFYRVENSGLYSNNIHDLEIDREGNLWVATKGGITKLKVKNMND